MLAFYCCNIPLGLKGLVRSVGNFLSFSVCWEHVLAASKTPSNTTVCICKERRTFLLLVCLMLYAKPLFRILNHTNCKMSHLNRKEAEPTQAVGYLTQGMGNRTSREKPEDCEVDSGDGDRWLL